MYCRLYRNRYVINIELKTHAICRAEVSQEVVWAFAASLRQQHLAPPTAAAAAVPPHRAERDLSPSCDTQSCVVPMSNFEKNERNLLVHHAWYVSCDNCQVTSFGDDGMRAKTPTKKHRQQQAELQTQQYSSGSRATEAAAGRTEPDV